MRHSLLALFAAFLASVATAQTFDAGSSSSGTSSPIAFSHTTGSGSARKLVACVMMRRTLGANPAPSVSAATYGGQSLTCVGSAAVDSGITFAEVCYLDSPSSGANTMSVSIADMDGPAAVHVATLEDAATGAPEAVGSWSSVGGNRSTDMGPSEITTVTDGAIVLECAAVASELFDDSINVASGQTPVTDEDGTILHSRMGRETVASAGAESNSWTVPAYATGRIVSQVAVAFGTEPASASNFVARCSDPAVIRCYDFDSLSDLETGNPNDFGEGVNRMYDPSGGGASLCTGSQCYALDSSVKVSGASSLRFEVPSNSGADTSGSFRLNFQDDYTEQVGEGEHVFVQYRHRVTSRMLSPFSGGGGWKLSIIGEGDQLANPTNTSSCTTLEMVIQSRAGDPWPTTYHGCGLFDPWHEFFDGTQVRLQHQGPPFCYFPDDPDSGCWEFLVDDWSTFQHGFGIGTWDTASTWIRVWAANEGEVSTLIADTEISEGTRYSYTLQDPEYSGGKYGKVWFLPYNTGKSSAESHAVANVWYDDLIISRAPIADPVDTSLSTLAVSMSAGDWEELTTTDINATLQAAGASQIVFGFTDDLQWDPVSLDVFFAGGDHADDPYFVEFDSVTNTWSRSRPAWMPTGSPTPMHGYDHSALDPIHRVYFHRPYRDLTIQAYDIDAGTWSTLPSASGVMSYNNSGAGVDWFPELDALVYVSQESAPNGSLVAWDRASNTWSELDTGLPMGDPHNFAEYNPVHQLVLFGGGNSSAALYTVNSAGTVTTKSDAPFDIGIGNTIITVDPVSGLYLVFRGSASTWYTYNVVTDAWALQAAVPPIWSTGYGNPVHGVAATPIDSYGVVFFATCPSAGADCFVTLYKHS